MLLSFKKVHASCVLTSSNYVSRVEFAASNWISPGRGVALSSGHET